MQSLHSIVPFLISPCVPREFFLHIEPILKPVFALFLPPLQLFNIVSLKPLLGAHFPVCDRDVSWSDS